MSPRPSPHTNKHMTPRGGLQAAEYEELGYGYLEIVENSVCYVDGRTGKRLIDFRYPTRRDAALQLSFFRQACQDAKRQQTITRLRQSRAEMSDQKAAMTEPRTDEKTTAGMAFSPFCRCPRQRDAGGHFAGPRSPLAEALADPGHEFS